MTTITDTDLLAQTVTMTGDMRRNADWIAELGQARRERWQELFENGVAQGEIARACDVTTQPSTWRFGGAERRRRQPNR